MKKIFVSFPTATNFPYLHKHVVFASWRLMSDKRYEVKMIIPSHNPFENNLHHILNQFMSEDYDYWLSIDYDNPPTKNPLDLVGLDKDIIGFPTPVWHFDEKNQKPKDRPYYWNAYDYVKEKDAYIEHVEKEGLQKVDAIGTGCFLIARRVFENENMRKAPFARQYNQDGTVNKGNDISFCERARKEGFDIFTHFDYPCLHFNNLEITEIAKGFYNLYG